VDDIQRMFEQDRPVKPASSIKVPHNPPPKFPTPPSKSSGGALWETFDEPDTQNLYDPRVSAADAERHMQDLVQQSLNDTNEDIDMTMAKVKGFQDNFELLPHQIVGRSWMKDRETGKKFGGILADDMGYVEMPIVNFTCIDILPSLGKTIQTLTRIVDGRPKRADKEAGFAAATLYVVLGNSRRSTLDEVRNC